MHYSHYIKSTITAHKERKKKRKKKKTETRESPDVNAKRRNNPIQTHTKNAQDYIEFGTISFYLIGKVYYSLTPGNLNHIYLY